MFSFLTAIFLTFILLIPLRYADEKKKKVKVTTMSGSKYYKVHDIWFYLWYALAILPIFFVSAFRDKTVGSDNRGIYYSSFIKSTRGIDDNHFELGFKSLVKVIAYVTDNYQWFDIITSIIILGLVSPNLGNEGDKEYINDFLNLNKYTFPVLFDDNASLVYQYGIQAFPSTFIIDKEGYIYQYVPGAMNKLTMKSLIDKAK